MKLIENKNIPIEDIEKLYNDVGWFNYTYDLHKLSQAFSNSLYTLSAWKDNELIGLVRIVGDGISIAYIQDVLILEKYQNQGIGTQLLSKVIDRFKNSMQLILMTDNHGHERHFYEKLGLTPLDQYQIVAFGNINSHI